MYIRIEGNNANRVLGIEKVTQLTTLDPDKIITVSRKKEVPVTFIKVKSGMTYAGLINEYITIHQDEELEGQLKKLEEVNYSVYNQFLLEKSMEQIAVDFTQIETGATEQERLKFLHDLNLTGVKPNSNLDYIRRW